MKNALSILIILYSLPGFSESCQADNPQLIQWKSQQTWTQHEVRPSELNPNIVYPVYETVEGEMSLGSMDQGIVTYKAKIDMSFKDNKKQERFSKSCRNQKIISVLNENGEGRPEREGYFKVSLSLLPELDSELMTSLVKDAETFEVNLWVAKDSRSKASSFPASESETAARLERLLNKKIQEQINSEDGFNGKIEVNFDGNGALACDLLTGKAKLRFYHFGQGQSLLERVDLLSKEKLTRIGEKVVATKPQSTLIALFTAGLVAQEANQMELISSTVTEIEPALLSLFNTSGVKTAIKPVDVQCVLDKTTTILGNKNKFENVFEIEIMEGL